VHVRNERGLTDAPTGSVSDLPIRNERGLTDAPGSVSDLPIRNERGLTDTQPCSASPITASEAIFRIMSKPCRSWGAAGGYNLVVCV